MMTDESKEDSIPKNMVIFFTIGMVCLFFISRQNYLLFHSLAEIFSIIIACGIFMFAWNSRQMANNNYLLFIGITYLFVGCIDLLHTLAYNGMGVFTGYDANLPTQLWIVSRYIESISLLIAPLFLKQKINLKIVFLGYVGTALLLLAAIFFWHNFPVCFEKNNGITPFKRISEYIISGLLICAGLILVKNRDKLPKTIFQLILTSILLTICAELSFTFYVSVYGLSNLVGHYLKIISFFLIYTAIIRTGLKDPHKSIFKELNDTTHELSERLKELRCHYNLSRLVGTENITLQEILQGTADSLPPALQYPENCCAEINLDGNSYQTVNFKRSPWQHSQEIIVTGEKVGHVKVYFLGGRLKYQERSFVEKEKTLMADITERLGRIVERRQTEEVKARLEAQLRHFHKMDAIGTMAGGIAHNFNNYLAAILGYTNLAQEEMSNNNLAKKHLEYVTIAANRAKDLVANIASFSHQINFTGNFFQPSQTCYNYITEIKDKVPPNILFDLNIFSDIQISCLEEKSFRSILHNLCTNALQAMQNTGGILTVNLKKTARKIAKFEEPDTIEKLGMSPVDCLELSISDTGQGISIRTQEQVFDPFFSTKEIGEGNGIGLSVVYGLVNNASGDVRLESEVGKGTTVHVLLPIEKKRLAANKIEILTNQPT